MNTNVPENVYYDQDVTQATVIPTSDKIRKTHK